MSRWKSAVKSLSASPSALGLSSAGHTGLSRFSFQHFEFLLTVSAFRQFQRDPSGERGDVNDKVSAAACGWSGLVGMSWGLSHVICNKDKLPLLRAAVLHQSWAGHVAQGLF